MDQSDGISGRLRAPTRSKGHSRAVAFPVESERNHSRRVCLSVRVRSKYSSISNLLSNVSRSSYRTLFFSYVWKIPVNYFTDREKNASGILWLNEKQTSFELESDVTWMKFNVDMKGYYRVCYQEDDWLVLIQQLNEEHTVT